MSLTNCLELWPLIFYQSISSYCAVYNENWYTYTYTAVLWTMFVLVLLARAKKSTKFPFSILILTIILPGERNWEAHFTFFMDKITPLCGFLKSKIIKKTNTTLNFGTLWLLKFLNYNLAFIKKKSKLSRREVILSMGFSAPPPWFKKKLVRLGLTLILL